MQRDILIRLNELRSRRKAAVLITEIDAGSAVLVAEGEAIAGDLQPAVELAFRRGTSSSVEVQGKRFFLNIYTPPIQIVIIGAVHIAQVLAPMARLAGFDVRIIDPRSAFASAERFPDTEVIIDWPQDVLEVDAYTALVAVSHVPDIDDFPLIEALRVGCFYVGALGSRKSHAARLGRLRNEGVDEAALARIHAPIGLDIGAANPAEIAISILADIVQALRRRDVSAKGDAKQ